MQIGEDHRRGITTALWLLDKAVCEFRSWAEGRACRSVLHEEENNLTPDQRKAILEETDRILSLLRAMRDELGLETRVEVAAETMRIRLATIWVNLMDLGGDHLRGYGKPPEELVRYLEPKVRELLAHVDRLGEVVRLKPERGG